MDPRPKTLFIDIDGTLLQHQGCGITQAHQNLPKLSGVLNKFNEWDRKNYNIILVSGRRESERALTIKQLESVGIVYDQLILGIGGGVRVLINDTKPDSDDPTAIAIVVKRNEGLSSVEI